VPKKRTLWKVTQGFTSGPEVDPASVQRPESKAKVYSIYVPNNVRAAQAQRAVGGDGPWTYDHTDVWCDERDGNGWQPFERVEHKSEGS
jgi:hypothetical protein